MYYKPRGADIGTNIKKCREIRNYTQHYMADELDISTTAYRNLESGKTAITLDYNYAIAAILSVNINALLHYDEQAILNVYNEPATGGIWAGTETRDIVHMLQKAQEKILEMADQNNRLTREVHSMARNISRLVLELTGLQKKKSSDVLRKESASGS